MRRAILVVLAIMALAGCNHTDGAGMEFDADPDMVQMVQLFGELTVSIPKGPVPDGIAREITVDSDKFMNVSLKFYEDFEIVHECRDMELLQEITYEDVLAYVYEADLFTYAPGPAEICVGANPSTFTYVLSDGRINTFEHENCGSAGDEREQLIGELQAYMIDIAEQEIEDCNESSYTAAVN